MKSQLKSSILLERMQKQSLFDSEYSYLQKLALIQLIIAKDDEDLESIHAWLEILLDTISDDALETHSNEMGKWMSSFAFNDWRSSLDQDLVQIIRLNPNIAHEVGNEELYREKLTNVLALVNRPGMTARSRMSDGELEQNTRLLDLAKILPEVFRSNPKTFKKQLFEIYSDSNLMELSKDIDRIKEEESQKRPVIIAIFEVVSKEFPELNNSMRAKITGYISSVMGIFDSEEEHNGSSRNMNYPTYLFNATRNHLRAVGLL